MLTVTLATPGTMLTAFSTQPGISPATGQPGRRQRHVDRDLAVVGDVDAIDQAELVDIGGISGS